MLSPCPVCPTNIGFGLQAGWALRGDVVRLAGRPHRSSEATFRFSRARDPLLRDGDTLQSAMAEAWRHALPLPGDLSGRGGENERVGLMMGTATAPRPCKARTLLPQINTHLMAYSPSTSTDDPSKCTDHGQLEKVGKQRRSVEPRTTKRQVHRWWKLSSVAAAAAVVPVLRCLLNVID